MVCFLVVVIVVGDGGGGGGIEQLVVDNVPRKLYWCSRTDASTLPITI